jgi:hypothetical protein
MNTIEEGRTMQAEKFFHLDCNQVIPECEFQCSRCIQEIFAVIGSMEGVADVSMGKKIEISGVVVQYDSETTTVDNLMKAFGKLPAFYRGRFVPTVLDV